MDWQNTLDRARIIGEALADTSTFKKWFDAILPHLPAIMAALDCSRPIRIVDEKGGVIFPKEDVGDTPPLGNEDHTNPAGNDEDQTADHSNPDADCLILVRRDADYDFHEIDGTPFRDIPPFLTFFIHIADILKKTPNIVRFTQMIDDITRTCEDCAGLEPIIEQILGF